MFDPRTAELSRHIPERPAVSPSYGCPTSEGVHTCTVHIHIYEGNKSYCELEKTTLN